MNTTARRKPQKKKQKQARPSRSAITAGVWLDTYQVESEYHVNRNKLYELIRDGKIQSFLFKRTADAPRGLRLILRSSMDEYMQKLCAEFHANKADVMIRVPKKGLVAAS